ncbi:P-type conjugative transfer protein TrbJ (plasmid) [Acidovorax carolinensis]|uniref:P-type conjugative transfer protein TrbJ n=2 Tax=Acidovorax carolinensis TaxID=553814 RepID=A0A240UJ68_9BURK|nr:P-type conjugative transfer protein TrbJ [Acidovorax carolinensis]
MQLGIRKTAALVVALSATAWVAPAQAGGAVAGATEFTQIANNLQLILSYEQQIESYVRQGLQLQAQLQNLVSNPTSLLGPEIGQMINTMGKIMSTGQSIGYNMAQIDKNFASTFKNPTAMNFSKMFTSWHKTNTDTLEGALKAIGAQRDQYASNEAALSDLYNRSQATKGNLDALQTMAQINVRQIQELQSLKELLGTQAQAQVTYMATQNAKDQKALDDLESILRRDPTPIPAAVSAPAPKWKNFGR